MSEIQPIGSGDIEMSLVQPTGQAGAGANSRGDTEEVFYSLTADAAEAATPSVANSSLGQNADDSDVSFLKLVTRLQRQAFRSKLLVSLVMYGFDGCAALVFALSVVGGSAGQQVAVILQGIAVAGVVLGLLNLLFSFVFVPPTLSAYAKIAASRLHKGGVEWGGEDHQVIQECQGQGSFWQVAYCLVYRSLVLPLPRRAAPGDAHGGSNVLSMSCQASQSKVLEYLGREVYQRSLEVLQSTTCMSILIARVYGTVLTCAFVAALSLGMYSSEAFTAVSSVPADPAQQQGRVLQLLAFMYRAYYAGIITCVGFVSVVTAACMPLQPWQSKCSALVSGIYAFTSKVYNSLDARLLVLISVCRLLWQMAWSWMPEFGICSLAGVWAWQGWADVMPKVRDRAAACWTVQGDSLSDCRQVLRSSILPTTTRLLLNGRVMLQVYYFTEWLRIVMLAVAAGLAVSWRASIAAGNPLDLTLRATMAVLSLAVTYTKSVRDKWKLLERAMQQLSYGGAVVLLSDLRLRCLELWPPDRTVDRTPPDQPQDAGAVVVPSAPKLHSIELVQGWRCIVAHLNEHGIGPLDAADEYIDEQLWLLQLKELVRRANKAVMAENIKACFL